MKPGIHYGVPMADYLALKAVNAGVIRAINERCAAAAWWESAFNPNRTPDFTDGSDAGTVAHAILLEGSRDCLQVIKPADHPNLTKPFAIPEGWTNKPMREARDAARAAGKIPILPTDEAEIDALVGSALRYVASLRDAEPAIHGMMQPGGGTSETVIVWQEGETLCKLRADRLSSDMRIILDYKSTITSAEPNAWARNMLDYVGAAWYRRGVRAATGNDCDYVFLAGERHPPYLHSLIGLNPADLALGDEKVGAGLLAWQKCERDGVWPGYPARCTYPEIPAWHHAQWMERNGVDADGIPYDPAALWGPAKEHPYSRKKETTP